MPPVLPSEGPTPTLPRLPPRYPKVKTKTPPPRTSWYGEWAGSWPTWAATTLYDARTLSHTTAAAAGRTTRTTYRRSVIERLSSVRLPEIPPRHLGRWLDIEQPEHRGADVGQRAAVAQRTAHRVAHNKKRHRVRGVRRVRAVRHGVDHQLAVAVIGRHEQRSAAPLGALDDALETLIDRLHRLHGRA